MASWVRNALAAATIAGLAPLASASVNVLTFDDLLPASGGVFTTDYYGFEFGDNSLGLDNEWYASPADPDDGFYAHSGTGVAGIFADGTLQTSLPITSATPFIFDGAYFSGYGTIEYQLSYEGAVVFTSSDVTDVSDTSSDFIASGYGGAVDSVSIIGYGGAYVMDDFTYETISAVPEPASFALILAGLTVVGFSTRRNSRK